MPKYDDGVRDGLINLFRAGDQPTEADFTNWITAVQEGIELHDHDGTGDGDGITTLAGVLTMDLANANVGVGVAPAAAHHLQVGDPAGGGVTGTLMVLGAGAFVGWGDRAEYEAAPTHYWGWYATGGFTHLHDAEGAASRITVEQGTGAVTIPNLAGANQPVGADAAGKLYVPHIPSDRKLKKNIKSLTKGLEVVKALRPVTFNWDKKELAKVGLDFGECGRQVGLVAQEVVEVLPHARSDGKQFEAYDKSMITPYLIEAIKELDTRLTQGGL